MLKELDSRERGPVGLGEFPAGRMGIPGAL